MATKKGAKKKAKSNWKGGSFRAAVGGYIEVDNPDFGGTVYLEAGYGFE